MRRETELEGERRCIDCGEPVSAGHGKPPRRNQDRHDYWGECLNALHLRIGALEARLAERDHGVAAADGGF